MSVVNARCACGHVEFEIKGSPLFRLYCHCTICQKFNDAPFADVVIYRATDVAEPQAGSVEYKAHKPPPNAQRGKCVKCHKPAIEKVIVPLFPKLTVVPAAVHGDVSKLPGSIAHVFYDKRAKDSTDSLPKYSGFISSQIAFGKFLLTSRKR